MALTFGSEYALFLHSTERLTYTQIETALTDAGLDDVSINRNPSGNGEYDIHLIVRHPEMGQPLPAVETITAIADAVENLGAEVPPEEPPV